MKTNFMILSLSATILFSLTGCGGTADRKVDSQTQTNTVGSLQLNESNYMDFARHYYAQNSLTKVEIPRNMMHLSRLKTNRDKSLDKNSFYIKSNKSANGEIESMIIRKGDRLISVSMDNGEVKVSLHGDGKVRRSTLSLDRFKNFDMKNN